MNNTQTPVEMLFQKAEDYSKTTIELLKLKAIGKTADVVSSLVSQLIIGIILLMFLLFINIGFALWIGSVMGKSYYGFIIVAGVYAFIGLVIYSFRNKLIKTPVSNSLIKQMLK